jgi:RNA polymerase sigma factor (sigma-70 family)
MNKETIDPLNYINLVAKIALRFIPNNYKGPLQETDEFQVGFIGLLNAIRTYKKNRKTKFIIYAYGCIIRQLVKEFVIKPKRQKRVPQKLLSSISDFDIKNKLDKQQYQQKIDNIDYVKYLLDNCCSKRQQKIVLDLINYNCTEVASMYGCTHQNISYIRKSAIKKMRNFHKTYLMKGVQSEKSI